MSQDGAVDGTLAHAQAWLKLRLIEDQERTDAERLCEPLQLHPQMPCLQLEGHIKARGQDNPSYPPRQPVRDELVPWEMPFSKYSPSAWTHSDVLANDCELSTGHKWADPPEVARAGLADRVSYAGDGLPKSLVLSADGKPRNPVGRTGMRDRGMLGKWGPNHAADPIVTRYHPKTGQLQMVAIQRKDTKQWAIPGGMVDDGEAVSATLRREFIKEAGNIADGEARAEFDKQVLSSLHTATPRPLVATFYLRITF